jgi:hypothetical protein
MNTKIMILALSVTALTSCSTAYKMGQTPDDVYFSPAREQSGYVAAENNEERYLAPSDRGNRYSPANDYNGYNEYDSYRNDRFLRMNIGNRMRYSAYNDLFWMDPYMTSGLAYNSFGLNFNSPWNSYHYWNSFYNPYSSYNYFHNPYSYNPYYGGYPNYGGVIVGGSKAPAVNNISRPKMFTPNSYTNNNFSNNNRYLNRNSSSVNQAGATR